MTTFADYLHNKHWEYCEMKGKMVTTSAWVRELNTMLPEDNKLSNGTVSQWMTNGRNPDSRNFVRLIQVFGLDVLPYLGVPIEEDFAKVASRWKYKSPEEKRAIMEIINKDEPESVTLQT